MVRIWLVLLFLFVGITVVTAQKKRTDYLLAYTVKSKDGELMGYKNRNGKIVIPARFFPGYGLDTLYERIFVQGKDGIQGIDRTGKVVLTPFIYDNGPDYIQEGLFRFVENGKIGFADANWKKVIPAAFDFVEPFKGGITKYTLGGQKVMDGEHWYWSGGYDGGYINRSGQRFKKVGELKGKFREAWTLANEHVLLNAKGKIIKRYQTKKSRP